jgi:cyclic-di-GMP-binding biofilm dispersal mediator protein
MGIAGANILVVAANGALGRELCAQLMAAGASVYGTARSNESSTSLPAGLNQALLLDLESEASIDTLTGYIISSGLELDGIVVASGLVAFGSIAETPLPTAEKLLRVNHQGPARLITALLPRLAQSQNEPFIVSISGVVAEKVFPGMAAYVTSKTAHSTWLKALAMEARRDGIRVLDARPGHTETGLATRAVSGVAPNFSSGMSAQHVVSVIVRAIEDGTNDLPSEAF